MAYTARQIWLAALTETNKTGAPSMLLSDYNYFINKAINLYVNKHYTMFDVTQQTTDDLRVLTATQFLKVRNVSFLPSIDGKVVNMNELGAGLSKLFAGTYEVILPSDYLHMLNCKCYFRMLSDFSCYDKGNYIPFDADRLTSDAKAVIESNAYLRPRPEKPYYCIHNVNVVDEIATNPRDPNYNPHGTDYTTSFKTDYENLEHIPTSGVGETTFKDVDGNKLTNVTEVKDENDIVVAYKNGDKYYNITGAEVEQCTTNTGKQYYHPVEGGDRIVVALSPSSNIPSNTGVELENATFSEDSNAKNPGFKRTITVKNPYAGNSEETLDIVDVKPAGVRLGNPGGVRCELICGRDDSVFKLEYVQIDYVKAPQHVRLTQEQIDLTRDTSQLMEFPDYVCQEIINELILLIMENQSNQRLQTHPLVSQSINYQQQAALAQAAQQLAQNARQQQR